MTELRGDLLADRSLPAGEGEREPLVEAIEQATGPARSGVGHGRLDGGSSLGEEGLGDERLVVLQAIGGLDLLPPVVGTMDSPQRLPGGDEVLGLPDGRWQDVGYVLDQVEGQADGLLEVPGIDPGD